MKYTNYLIITGIILITGTHLSCKKSGLIVYESARSLYFDVTPKEAFLNPEGDPTKTTDSVMVLFSFMENAVTETELKIPIKMAGIQSEVPLAYTIAINPVGSSATDGVDFELPKQLHFPSRQSVDTLRIKVKRTKGMLQKALTLALELKPNENFEVVLKPNILKTRATNVRCYFSDILSPPPGYVSTETVSGADFYYGTFSRKKLSVITTAAGNIFLPPPTERTVYYTLLMRDPSFLSSVLNSYLQMQKLTGNTIYEEDGTEMAAGPFYKK
ncbi:protein of unknown function [Pedobacter steynii]|uniref:DUF4843 domain-containing protein n=2 Tax=Pedobacter steynii TaxID=430522 RepID=A0A1G9NWJ3_9SPHI|nr:DUF4843 domain-containing protein [Pedobacter steynii]NQX39179.1 DUF4843 domain-containing protein [Pedobacter steynii]SDL90397.1 protein of unknown function [Pedobacter steynii]